MGIVLRTGIGLGKGTAVVWAWLGAAAGLAPAPAETGAQSGHGGATSGPQGTEGSGASPPASAGGGAGGEPAGGAENTWQRLREAMDPLGNRLEPNLAAVRAAVEANAPRRKPKIPKGTRDFLPDQVGSPLLPLGNSSNSSNFSLG